MFWHIAVRKKCSRWKVEVSGVSVVTGKDKSLFIAITQ
jgi:hypothetical protein